MTPSPDGRTAGRRAAGTLNGSENEPPGGRTVGRTRRALELGRADVDAAVLNASTADEFFLIMQKWVRSFSSPEGELRRRFRIEVLGSAITREKLQEKIREANRVQAKNLGALLAIAKDRQWLSLDVAAEDLSIWWTGLVLSRHLVEIDPAGLDAEAWDYITIEMMRSIIRVKTN